MWPELRSVASTAALSDNSLLRAVDATDRNSIWAKLLAVFQPNWQQRARDVASFVCHRYERIDQIHTLQISIVKKSVIGFSITRNFSFTRANLRAVDETAVSGGRPEQ